MDLLLTLDSGRYRDDSSIVCSPANRGQECLIALLLEHHTGIAVIDLHIGRIQRLQVVQRLEVATLLIGPPTKTELFDHGEQTLYLLAGVEDC